MAEIEIVRQSPRTPSGANGTRSCPRKSNACLSREMIFPSCQTVKLTWLDELAFALAFLLLTLISKSGLEGKWSYSPAAFVAWQSLFTIVVFVCLLIHSKIRKEVKVLDRANLILVLPACISHTFVLLTGASALSALPVPIYLAVSNVCPSIVVLIARRSKNFRCPITLSLISLFLSVIIILVINSKEINRQLYLFLFQYVVMNVFYSLYVKRINPLVPDFTLIFYINLITFVISFPYGVYSAIETPVELSQILPCLLSGFNSLAVEIFAFRIKAKNEKILIVQGVATFLTILASFYLFDSSLDLLTWGLIGVNCFTTGFILNFDEDANKSNQFILVVPHMTKNVFVEKYVNYNDMA